MRASVSRGQDENLPEKWSKFGLLRVRQAGSASIEIRAEVTRENISTS